MGNTISDRKNARCYSLKFSRNTDAELIEWLDSQESIQGYLKSLIRADMMKEGKTMKKYTVDKLTPAAIVSESYSDGMDRETILRFEADPDLSWNQVEAKLAEAGIDVSGYSRDFGVIGAYRFNPEDDGPSYEVYA